MDSEASKKATADADPCGAGDGRDPQRVADALARLEAGEEGPDSAVIGTEPCLDALRHGRVDVLFVSGNYDPPAGWACDDCGLLTDEPEVPRACPACGRAEIRRVELKEEMVRLAEQRGAEVRLVPGGTMSRTRGVACLLRQDTPGPARAGGLGHYLVVAAVLYAFWVLLSGHMTALLLGIGAASVALVVVLFRRMDRVDAQVSWTRPSLGLLLYLFWLLWTAIKSSFDVARRIWDPSLPISPSWKRLDTEICTPLKKTLYANSITLTPGTLTTSAHDDHLMVHSLADANLEELKGGEMERRIRKLRL